MLWVWAAMAKVMLRAIMAKVMLWAAMAKVMLWAAMAKVMMWVVMAKVMLWAVMAKAILTDLLFVCCHCQQLWPQWFWLICCLCAVTVSSCGLSDADWFAVCVLSAFVTSVILTDLLFVCCQDLWPQWFWLICCLCAVSICGLIDSDWFAVCVLSAFVAETMLTDIAACLLLAVVASVILTDFLFVCCQQFWPQWFWLICCLHAGNSYGRNNADWFCCVCVASSYGHSDFDWFAVCVLWAVLTKVMLWL